MAERPARSGRLLVLFWFRSALAVVVLCAAAAYLADFAVLRFRIATNRDAFGKITVRPVYAVPQKNHSTEFLIGDSQDQRCVHSIFPHAGNAPCWYLSRHRDPQIDM